MDLSYRTLTASGDDAVLYTEMEMMIPDADDVGAAVDFLKFQESVKAYHDPSVRLFTGVRYVEPETTWLSPFYGRTTAVFSMIVLGNSTATGKLCALAATAAAAAAAATPDLICERSVAVCVLCRSRGRNRHVREGPAAHHVSSVLGATAPGQEQLL